MISLHAITSVGFGGYRVSDGCAEHEAALVRALDLGCNLIDTSPNYANGLSEQLIGRCLANRGEDAAFVITKAGYAQGDNLAALEQLRGRGVPEPEVVVVDESCKHSIHPLFLRDQARRSRERLGGRRLDALLLHNPEHYLLAGGHRSEYDRRIAAAFVALEQMVSEGIIRYYGISSNTLPLAAGEPSRTSLDDVMRAARGAAPDHHCKFIQFPFNFIEDDAAQPNAQGLSLVARARAQGVITVANRPLNASVAEQTVRLAEYDEGALGLDAERDTSAFQEVCERVRAQLIHIGRDEEPMDFAVMMFLRDSWMQIHHPDLVDQVFGAHLAPFLHQLYDGDVSAEDRPVYLRLHQLARRYAQLRLGERAQQLREDMVTRGAVARHDRRPLALLACSYALDRGIDHVLVGMRRPGYVEQLAPLWSCPRAERICA